LLYAKVFIALWSEPGVTTAHPLENSQKQTNIRIFRRGGGLSFGNKSYLNLNA